MTPAWRGDFADDEVRALHADAFGAPSTSAWRALAERHSLGWVTARDGGALVGFANVPWDGRGHAWLQDVMVASTHRRRGIGAALVRAAATAATDAGCDWLHVDFEERLAPFYLGACGFAPTAAGLLRLERQPTE